MPPILERLKSNLLPFLYASEGRIDGQFYPAQKMERDAGLEMPVLQINGPRCIRYLCFDVDRKDAGIAWDDANLPIPNLILINPKNGHAHLIWELANPIWLRRAGDDRPGDAMPVRYVKAVQNAMGAALRSDRHYNGLMVKNPFHASWATRIGREAPYTLAELSRHLELSSAPQAKLYEDGDGRNCTLFCSLRLFAYRIVDEYRELGRFEAYKATLSDELERLNDSFRTPLPYAELRDILKSVSKWTWKHYRGSGRVIRKGVMQLDPALSLRVRQQLAQQRTTGIVVSKTVAILRTTILDLLRDSVTPTISEVSHRSHKSRNTVYHYWSRFTDLLTDKVTSETVSLRDGSPLGASPRQADTLIPTRLNKTFAEVQAECSDQQNPIIKAMKYTLAQARMGILIAELPRTFESSVLRAIDKWREQGAHDEINDQRIAQ